MDLDALRWFGVAAAEVRPIVLRMYRSQRTVGKLRQALSHRFFLWCPFTAGVRAGSVDGPCL